MLMTQLFLSLSLFLSFLLSAAISLDLLSWGKEPLSFNSSNRSKKMAALPETSPAWGYSLLKRGFSSPPQPTVCSCEIWTGLCSHLFNRRCLEITFLWIDTLNKVESNWIAQKVSSWYWLFGTCRGAITQSITPHRGTACMSNQDVSVNNEHIEWQLNPGLGPGTVQAFSPCLSSLFSLHLHRVAMGWITGQVSQVAVCRVRRLPTA